MRRKERGQVEGRGERRVRGKSGGEEKEGRRRVGRGRMVRGKMDEKKEKRENESARIERK